MSGDGDGGTTRAGPRASYANDPLGRLLAKVAERTPAPGGGSVAAISVSLAAALVEMAARFSTTQVEDADELVGTAHRLRIEAGRLADADSEAYRRVIAASARRDGADPERRAAILRAALRRASDAPLEVARIGAETAVLAARLMAEGNHRLRGDCATALLLAESATRAAAHLVSLNAAAAGGDELLVRRARRSADLARAAAAPLA